MTRREIVALTRKWQRRLGLDSWEITVEFMEEPGDCWALVRPSTQYRLASIRFDPGLHTRTEDEVAKIVVHELMHVLMRDVDQTFEAVADCLHPQAGEQASKRYTHAVEGFVDGLAAIIPSLATTPRGRSGKPAAVKRRAPRQSRRASSPASRRPS